MFLKPRLYTCSYLPSCLGDVNNNSAPLSTPLSATLSPVRGKHDGHRHGTILTILLFPHFSFQMSSVIYKQNKTSANTVPSAGTPRGATGVGGRGLKMKSVRMEKKTITLNPQTNSLSETNRVSLWPCFHFGKHGIPAHLPFPLT